MKKRIVVRAVKVGEYKGRIVEKGEVFVVDEDFFADINHKDPALAQHGWMEEVKQEPKEKRTLFGMPIGG